MSIHNELKYRAMELWLKAAFLITNYILLPTLEISKIFLPFESRQIVILVSNSVLALAIVITFFALYYKLNRKFNYEFQRIKKFLNTFFLTFLFMYGVVTSLNAFIVFFFNSEKLRISTL